MGQFGALSDRAGFTAGGRRDPAFAPGQEKYGVEITKVRENKGYCILKRRDQSHDLRNSDPASKVK